MHKTKDGWDIEYLNPRSTKGIPVEYLTREELIERYGWFLPEWTPKRIKEFIDEHTNREDSAPGQ